jgi:hypothetical protein
MYMGPSRSGEMYSLILKDDAASYIWLIACKRADAETPVRALMQWFAAFGISLVWVSDQGAHFKNEIMAKLSSELHVTHRFSPAYTPRANGTVESVCKRVLRASRALLADFKLQPDDWPRVPPLIQSVLNNSASDRLGGHTPMMAFTGHQVTDPLALALTDNIVVPANYDFIKAQQSVKVHELQQQVADIDKEVAESSKRSRRQKIEAHNKKTYIKAQTSQLVIMCWSPCQRGNGATNSWQCGEGPERLFASTRLRRLRSRTSSKANALLFTSLISSSIQIQVGVKKWSLNKSPSTWNTKFSRFGGS